MANNNNNANKNNKGNNGNGKGKGNNKNVPVVDEELETTPVDAAPIEEIETPDTQEELEVPVEETIETPVEEKPAEGNETPAETETNEGNETPVEESTPDTQGESEVPAEGNKTSDKEESTEESKSAGACDIKGSNSKVQIGLMNKFNCRFATSSFMKTCAVLREMTIFNMLELFINNRTMFVGLTSMEDLNKVKDFILNNTVSFRGSILEKEAKKQFIEKLTNATEYVVVKFKSN